MNKFRCCTVGTVSSLAVVLVVVAVVVGAVVVKNNPWPRFAAVDELDPVWLL